MHSSPRLCAAVAMIAGLTVAVCSGAPAQASVAPRSIAGLIPGFAAGDGWTALTGVDALSDPTLTVVDGTPTGDRKSCEVPPSAVSDSPDGPATVEDQEVAIDLSTCQVLMQSGTPPASVVTAAFADRGAPARSGGDPTGFLDPNGTYTTTQVEYAAVWEDGEGDVVNEVSERLSWTSDGSCVDRTNHWAVWFPHAAGWVQHGARAPHSASCDGTEVAAGARFSDRGFCSAGVTRDQYTALDLTGLPDGTTQTEPSAFADGSSCASQESLRILFHRDFSLPLSTLSAPEPRSTARAGM
jgi:hypothetical protein